MPRNYKGTEKEKQQGREYVRRHREKRRSMGLPANKNNGGTYNQTIARMYVDRYLLEHPCVDCGYPDPRALEFDHVRGKKSFEISVAISRGLPLIEIMNEIEKCDVRCANCHRIRHKQ
jgi:hypothetical protein